MTTEEEKAPHPTWEVSVRGQRASLLESGGETVLTVGGQSITLAGNPDQVVMLLHSLCHVAMDHHADEHSSCHERKE